MKSLFTVDFAADTIYASKTTLKKAGIPNSPEYKEMMRWKKQHPTFKVVAKDIKKAAGKNTHRGLTDEIITQYIAIQSNYNVLKVEYEQTAKEGKFPLVRKWFLNTFKGFDLETAKEEIAMATINKIKAAAAAAEKSVEKPEPAMAAN